MIYLELQINLKKKVSQINVKFKLILCFYFHYFMFKVKDY